MVIDASGVIKWFVPEEYAPDLLFAEIANVMWKLATVPCRDLAKAACSLSIATGRSAYDAMYLALALRLNTQLITADTRFINAIRVFPVLAPHISFIADS